MIKVCGCRKHKSVTGLGKGFGPCEKHYNMFFFGSEEDRHIASRYVNSIAMPASEFNKRKKK